MIIKLNLTVSLPAAIGNAYAVLSNAKKRQQYDQCGEEKKHPSSNSPDNGNFEADISPEDLFNMFFGGGYPSSKCRCFVFSLQACETVFSLSYSLCSFY